MSSIVNARLSIATLLCVISGTVATPAAGQLAERAPAEDGKLTIAFIMQGPELVGTSPSQLRWSPDGKNLYFVWKRPDEERQGLYRVSRDGGRPQRVPDAEAERIAPRLEAVFSEDRVWAAYAHEGDLYLLQLRPDRERLLASFPGRLSSVQISRDGGRVYFVRDDNLFRVDALSGAITQLTDIRHGRAPDEDKPAEGQRKFLKDEQRELLRVFEADSIRRARRWPPPADTAKVDTPQAFYVQDKQRISGYHVSPDGMRMAFDLTEEAKEVRLAWVPDYVTEDGYTRQAPRKRAFVGDEQSAEKVGIMDLVSGAVTWVSHGQEEREVRLMFRGWSDDSRRLLAVGISDDFHDRWIFAVDAASGESKVVDHLRDDAWIGGPGWNAAGWMPRRDHVWFIAEASGFAHLYTMAVGGDVPTPLTTGPWEVLHAELSPDKKEWHLLTSEASPHSRGFYRMDLDGSDRQLITGFASLHGSSGRDMGGALALAPDGRRLAALYSWPDRPPELFLQDSRPGVRPTQITESPSEAFRARRWTQPEIIYFSARDGADVPARLYRPQRPNGAGVIFVHGAGYLQNVHGWWSGYYREYMFHNLLLERGYTVLDIDYRGSAGYGRDWRTAIRKRMGGTDLTDQLDGARFMVESLGVDPQRIGIYGGSYGGFITLMAMFTAPGTFAAGAALRPVTDWAYYNHWYTSRILGLPQDDAEAYRNSSPIYQAEGLEGALLIAHGMIDQNVHFQDTVRLVERLMELGKENWEVAIYPKEDHGFVHDWAWTDEYRRILELFDEHLR